MAAVKLLFLVNPGWFFESHRLPLALAAKEAGYEVHLALPGDPVTEAVTEAGFNIHVIPMTRQGASLRSEIRSLWEIYKLYKKIRPEIVHHVTIKPVLYGSLIARLLKIPAVVNAFSGLGHVFIAKGWKAGIRRFLISFGYKIAFKHPNCIGIVQNLDDGRVLQSYNVLTLAQTVLIKGSGVDLSKYDVVPEPEGKPVVTLASRLIAEKGINEFIAAARIVKNARFMLVGDVDEGNPSALREDKIRQWEKSGLIDWLGFSKDINSTFKNSSIVVLPSYREGLPKVLIEALACGRPIVTTDTAGCREMIDFNDPNGILVPVKDVIDLAGSIQKLVNNREKRVSMGLSGRKWAEKNFAIETILADTLGVYTKLVPHETKL